MMLKQVKFIDYDANYAYSPPEKDAVINLAEIVSVVPLDPYVTRSSYDLVRVRFRDGSSLDVIGVPADFVVIEVR